MKYTNSIDHLNPTISSSIYLQFSRAFLPISIRQMLSRYNFQGTIVHSNLNTWPVNLNHQHEYPDYVQTNHQVHYKTCSNSHRHNREYKNDYNCNKYYLYIDLQCPASFYVFLPVIKFKKSSSFIWKQDPEANIWAQEGWEWGVEKAHTTRNFVVCTVKLI